MSKPQEQVIREAMREPWNVDDFCAGNDALESLISSLAAAEAELETLKEALREFSEAYCEWRDLDNPEDDVIERTETRLWAASETIVAAAALSSDGSAR